MTCIAACRDSWTIITSPGSMTSFSFRCGHPCWCKGVYIALCTCRHQVTGMKHSRSASFEANGYADPQSSAMLGDSLSWPSPSSWTVPSRAYKYRTVSFNFSDPRMPGILRRPIQVPLLSSSLALLCSMSCEGLHIAACLC